MGRYPSITPGEFRSLPLYVTSQEADDDEPFLTPSLISQLRQDLKDGMLVYYMVREGTTLHIKGAVIYREEEHNDY